jgi:transposase
MTWMTEDRRRYAPAIHEIARQGMMVRLGQTVEAIDPQPGIGRQRLWSSLSMLPTLWHLARDGCAWRRLPCCFPPHTTVWSRLCRWRKRGVLERVLAVVVACHRLACGRKRRPMAGIVNTQSVRTGPQAGPRGFDASKKVKGRKRVLLVDTDGNLLGVQVMPADTHDHRALLALRSDLAVHPSLLLIWLEGLRRREARGLPRRVRHRGRDHAHAGPPRLRAREAPLEGRAGVRQPAALLPAARG